MVKYIRDMQIGLVKKYFQYLKLVFNGFTNFKSSQACANGYVILDVKDVLIFSLESMMYNLNKHSIFYVSHLSSDTY